VVGAAGGSIRKLQDRYAGYDVMDADGGKIGTVDTTYVNELDQREYVAVSGTLTGLIPGTSSSVVPLDICMLDNNRRAIQASTHKDSVKNSPSLSTSQEMTPEYEAQVRNYYRL
jgi:hypothetical protein